MHDARLGRFWSVDPLTAKYPWNSTYAFAENSPIGFLELEGLEAVARPARNAPNTRPVFYGRNNNYARTELGRLPSTRTITTYTHSYSMTNGARTIVSSPTISYIYDYHSPQGNNVSMSNNNIQAQVLALFGDGCQIFTTKIEDKINTTQGFKTFSSTQITFVKIQDQLMFNQLQNAYDVLLDKKIGETPEPDMSFPPWTSDIMQQMIKQAERTHQAKEKLGPSPNDMLMQTLLFGKKNILSKETETFYVPEIREAEN